MFVPLVTLAVVLTIVLYAIGAAAIEQAIKAMRGEAPAANRDDER